MINFNGVDLGEYLTVNNIDRSILPAQENTTINIPGRAGSLFVKKKDGSKPIPCEITIVEENSGLLRLKLNELASVLGS